ncbi:hypothetical protein [Romboutsia sp. 1001216sp1]|uniref:hypothetical protein n=1 Tax=Romboutsia sp. 1001216sp1 TaxID=2986997 RepID=UPI00232C897D|nr:hypothetical protein [Romboutsia sp. 1001216sp1]
MKKESPKFLGDSFLTLVIATVLELNPYRKKIQKMINKIKKVNKKDFITFCRILKYIKKKGVFTWNSLN